MLYVAFRVVLLSSSVRSAILLNKIFIYLCLFSICRQYSGTWTSSTLSTASLAKSVHAPVFFWTPAIHALTNCTHKFARNPSVPWISPARRQIKSFFQNWGRNARYSAKKGSDLLKKVLNSVILNSSSTAGEPGSSSRNLNLESVIYCFTQCEKHEVTRNVTQL